MMDIQSIVIYPQHERPQVAFLGWGEDVAGNILHQPQRANPTL